MPVATVIIPTKNEEKHIAKVLYDLANQTVRCKVIVVDSKSSDATVEIAKAHGAEVVIKPSATVGLARHIGTLKADTPYVLHTDADARLPPEWAERHIKWLRSHSVVTGSVILPISSPAAYLNTLIVELQKFGAMFGHAMAANMSFRKSAYSDYVRFPDVMVGEDTILLRKMLKAGYSHKHDPDIKVWMPFNAVKWFRIWLLEVVEKYASQHPEG